MNSLKPELGSLAALLEDMEREPYETVFVIGAGLVAGGWRAFEEGIRRALGSGYADGSPVHPIAWVTFTLRMLANAGKTDRASYKECLARLEGIRSEVVKVFSEYESEGKLSLRITARTDYFEKLRKGRSLIVTTNWDTQIEKNYTNSGRSSVIYLHGNIRPGVGIYLPTETSIEPYRTSVKQTAYMMQTHRAVIEAFEHSKRMVLWGISLDTYDAELCALIGSIHAQNPKSDREYIVVDPTRAPLERLRAITDSDRIRYINPLTRLERLKSLRDGILNCIHTF